MTLQLQIATHSEIGLVRKNNQDSGYASARLLVVADGMGGAAAGDLASAVAVDTIRSVDRPTPAEQMLPAMSAALFRANERIADLVDDDFALEGMGTTVTGALFDGTQFGLAHIGDSRAYLLHRSRLERLTHDHSFVQSLVDEGKISEHQAAVHPHRSLLLKVLNGQPANSPDLTMVSVGEGDRLLLCSDGLCGLVDDLAIEAALRRPDLDDALHELVEEALAAGGVDNITVILADVVEAGDVPGVVGTAVVLGAAAELAIPVVPTRPGARGLDVDTEPGEAPPLPRGEPTRSAAADVVTAGAATGTAAAAGHGPAAAEPGGEGTEPDDESRYSPQPPAPRRRRVPRPLVGVLALVLVVGALAGAYAWTRTQYFVGASAGRVAIYRGLSDSLPGVPLSRLYEVQPLSVSALPPFYQQRVLDSIDVDGLPGARQTVTELGEAVRRCATQPPRSAPSATTTVLQPSPSASPGGAGTAGSPRSTLGPGRTALPTLTPTVSTVVPRTPATPGMSEVATIPPVASASAAPSRGATSAPSASPSSSATGTPTGADRGC